jgi:hypothetical protein
MEYYIRRKEEVEDVAIPKHLVSWRWDVLGRLFKKYFMDDFAMHIIHLN